MPDLPSLRRRPREPTAYVIGRRASVTRNTRYRWPRRSSELPALSDDKALREELRPASGPQVSRQSIAHGRDGRSPKAVAWRSWLAHSLGKTIARVIAATGKELAVRTRQGARQRVVCMLRRRDLPRVWLAEPWSASDLAGGGVVIAAPVGERAVRPAQAGDVAVVVPNLAAAAPVSVAGGIAATTAVNGDRGTGRQFEAPEAIHMPVGVADRPAAQLPGVPAHVSQPNPLAVEAPVGARVPRRCSSRSRRSRRVGGDAADLARRRRRRVADDDNPLGS